MRIGRHPLVQEWRGLEAALRLRAMQRKLPELRTLATNLLADPRWVGAPLSQLEQVPTMDKSSVANLVASGQLALEKADERSKEAAWAMGHRRPLCAEDFGACCQQEAQALRHTVTGPGTRPS